MFGVKIFENNFKAKQKKNKKTEGGRERGKKRRKSNSKPKEEGLLKYLLAK